MVHSNKGKPKYYCKTRYFNEDNTGCVTSVLDETLEGIIINEFNQIKENRLDAKKVIEEQKAQRNLRINRYEEKIRELSKIKEEYNNRLMANYEAYKEGTLSKEEYLDSKGKEIKLNKLNRELVEQLIERIVVGTDRVEIEWN